MVDHATAKYLSDNIGGQLSKALAEMAIAQPADGVDFLANWLRIHSEQESEKARLAEEDVKLKEARAKSKAALDAKEEKRRVREEKLNAKEAMYEDFMKKLSDPKTDFQETFWKELVAVAGTLTGAKAVYLGLLDEEGLEDAPGPLITYQEATPEATDMLDKVLKQEEGVTWGAVTENPGEEVQYLWKPPSGPPPEADPETGETPPEPPLPPYLPVSIDCVTDTLMTEKKVHFFDMTRLGAYLAVPLVYNSYYTPTALEAAKKWEEEKKAREQKRAELQKEYDDAVEAALKDGGESAAKEVAKPPELEETADPPMELSGKPVKMVLCVDTLGTNKAIEDSKIEPAVALCKACAVCKEETEKRQVDAQAIEAIDEEARENLLETIVTVRARTEEDTQDDIKADEAELDPEAEQQKELVHKKWHFLRAVRVLLELKDEFLKLKQRVVIPDEMLKIVCAICLLFGYKKQQLYPKRKAELRWDVLCKVLDDKFFKLLQESDVLAAKKGIEAEQKLVNIKAMIPPEYDSEKAKLLAPAFGLLFGVLEAAIEYRHKHLSIIQADFEKAKEEAKEKEEEFTEQPLEERDDDFEALSGGA